MASTPPISSAPISAALLYEASVNNTGKILFVSPRISDRSALTASTQVDTLPIANVQTKDPSKVWRTLSNLDQHVDFSLATAIAVDTLAFTWPYGALSETATVRLTGYSLLADVGIAPAVDSGLVSVWPGGSKHVNEEWGPEVACVRIANVSAYRYWRIVFDDPGSAFTYIDISRIALGVASQFKINPRYDGGIGFIPLDIQEPNGYGQVFTDSRPYQQRQFELVWSALGEQDVLQDAMEIARLHGQSRDLFVFLSPGEMTYFHIKSMQALFEGSHKFAPQPVIVPDKDGNSRLGWGFSLTLVQVL